MLALTLFQQVFRQPMEMGAKTAKTQILPQQVNVDFLPQIHQIQGA